MTRMIRKQVYVTAEHAAFLKRGAHELGVTESELIRQGIERLEHAWSRGTWTTGPGRRSWPSSRGERGFPSKAGSPAGRRTNCMIAGPEAPLAGHLQARTCHSSRSARARLISSSHSLPWCREVSSSHSPNEPQTA